MWGQWRIIAVRQPGHRRSCVRRSDGSDRFIGTTAEVLSFIARAQTHLSANSVCRVEAWSSESVGAPFNWLGDSTHSTGLTQLTPLFTIRPHPNGHDWIADENELHHGGWYRRLQSAIDYAFFRASGKVAAVEVLNRGGRIHQIILADQRGYDAIPTVAASVRTGADSNR
jgi:hypothetical protein